MTFESSQFSITWQAGPMWSLESICLLDPSRLLVYGSGAVHVLSANTGETAWTARHDRLSACGVRVGLTRSDEIVLHNPWNFAAVVDGDGTGLRMIGFSELPALNVAWLDPPSTDARLDIGEVDVACGFMEYLKADESVVWYYENGRDINCAVSVWDLGDHAFVAAVDYTVFRLDSLDRR